MSQAVLPHMIERGAGRIVNISSIIGAGAFQSRVDTLLSEVLPLPGVELHRDEGTVADTPPGNESAIEGARLVQRHRAYTRRMGDIGAIAVISGAGAT